MNETGGSMSEKALGPLLVVCPVCSGSALVGLCGKTDNPDVPCVRCERPMLEARIAALESRVAALESRRDAERYRETVLADEREFGPSEW